MSEIDGGASGTNRTEKRLFLNGREFILIGTAHISPESVEEVQNAVSKIAPDCVAVELDQKRYEAMINPSSWRNLDIVSVLKKKEGFLLLANLVLSSFQRRMGQNIGIRPGDEMKAAVEKASEMNIPVAMVDRPIHITLRRAWLKNSLWGKSKLVSALLASAFSNEKVSAEQIESLKKSNEMDSMMAELAEFMPVVKEVLIDERDRFLASHIWTADGNKILAVIGAGHLVGVQKHLEAIAAGKETSNTADIETLPEQKISAKVLAWIIPCVIVALIAAGFLFGGIDTGKAMVGSWILWNALLSALGAALAFGHPLTVICAGIAAPITSLSPFIGAGMVSGLVQAIVRKPKVSDMESIQTDIMSLKGIYKNRISRVLLVFLLSSLGSSIGTFVAGASFVGLSGLFSK
ncbi:TraB/GumN family protein [Treponema parvum]|uniref:TraB/GumN family protein n=1 Tax=Treponema parvum TaxID=138851 RepID=UPI001AEC2B59|nr:TraB/GumN family protein [Treponema parvum]QTQ15459.1 TraB/GumN family protein [Treponema parvum]